MKTLDISVPYTNSRHIFNIYAMGDIHAGTKHCNEKRVDSAIATMEQDEFCAVVGTGDYGEFIAPNDKRFDIESLASWVKPANICTSQEEWITKKFKKLAGQGKLKVLLEGNHEATRKQHDNQDVMDNICTALDVPNGGHVTCLRFFFDRERSQETHMFTCIFTHGSSGAITLSGKVAALVAFMGQYTDTDLFGYAHTHALVTDVEIPKLCVTGKRNEPKVADSMRNGALTGSFFTTYTQGISPSYGEKKNYTPNTLGCVRYELNIKTHSVDIFKV
jgi:hypothetical protein